MKKISTLEELQLFIGEIISDDGKFLSHFKDIKPGEFDFFQVYEKIILLVSDYYNVTITLKDVPFNMKFSLVSFTINSFSNEDITKKFFDSIFKADADSNNPILAKVREDYIACVDLANISCISGNLDLCYMILNHISKNFTKLPASDYPECIMLLSYLVGYLSTTIHLNLYGDKENCIHPEIQKFIFSFMKINRTKKEETSVYKVLLAEYPKILKVYQELFNVLERFQQLDNVIIIL